MLTSYQVQGSFSLTAVFSCSPQTLTSLARQGPKRRLRVCAYSHSVPGLVIRGDDTKLLGLWQGYGQRACVWPPMMTDGTDEAVAAGQRLSSGLLSRCYLFSTVTGSLASQKHPSGRWQTTCRRRLERRKPQCPGRGRSQVKPCAMILVHSTTSLSIVDSDANPSPGERNQQRHGVPGSPAHLSSSPRGTRQSPV